MGIFLLFCFIIYELLIKNRRMRYGIGVDVSVFGITCFFARKRYFLVCI